MAENLMEYTPSGNPGVLANPPSKEAGPTDSGEANYCFKNMLKKALVHRMSSYYLMRGKLKGTQELTSNRLSQS